MRDFLFALLNLFRCGRFFELFVQQFYARVCNQCRTSRNQAAQQTAGKQCEQNNRRNQHNCLAQIFGQYV